MSYSDDLRAEIARLDRRKSDLEAEQSQLKKRLAQLNEQLSRLIKQQNDFETRQSNRRNTLQNLRWAYLENHSAERYADMMENMVNGGKNSNVADALSQSIALFKNHIRAEEERMADLGSSLNNIEEKQADCRYRLSRASDRE
ncbi:hypothetical protein OZX62_00290 [Bifidobacterium sp. ESL0690]|uniref:hypothetical protein n=1 Tax=Bifidobacterium sp. ESL0690 TaxID=2983214 RepID=UPI0023F93F9F|nr:hypothetical protein [Bifidobacterium sp. ESL0690]WEV46787.1 hypothetical protein OZX62_00290 [Bifidobacterium sp. ESL0690]